MPYLVADIGRIVVSSSAKATVFSRSCSSYIIFPKNPSSLADVAWGLNIVFSALNIVQRPQHRFLAKLWHKNDVFDEKKVCGGPKRRPETARLTSPREF